MEQMDGKTGRIEEIKPKLNLCIREQNLFEIKPKLNFFIREPNLFVLNKNALLCSLKENKYETQEDVLH